MIEGQDDLSSLKLTLVSQIMFSHWKNQYKTKKGIVPESG
jgi:hypothetical protein